MTRASIKNESSDSESDDPGKDDLSAKTKQIMERLQILHQTDCANDYCTEHGAGDSPDEEDVVANIQNNNGKTSLKKALASVFRIIKFQNIQLINHRSSINHKKLN